MKNSFNFIQLANLIYILRDNLLKIHENINDEDFIKIMLQQKKHLELFKDVLDRKKKIIGIQKKFLKNLLQIKKELNLEE